MRRATRVILAALIACFGVAVMAATLDYSAAADQSRCKPKPLCSTPTPEPTDESTPPPAPAKASYPVTGSVQALVAPTPPLSEDAHATPGPVVGTLVTPPGEQAVPVSAPVITGHPQQETGLELLLVAAGVLAMLTLGAITLAVIVR